VTLNYADNFSQSVVLVGVGSLGFRRAPGRKHCKPLCDIGPPDIGVIVDMAGSNGKRSGKRALCPIGMLGHGTSAGAR
jgi:hypothetical protein